MPRYFFNTRLDGDILRDDIGHECADETAAMAVAVNSLAELAKEVLPGAAKRLMSVEISDEERVPLSSTEIRFEARKLG